MAATIKDVARLAGVAQSTVSLVINNKGRINEETRKRILKAIKELDYHPRRSARGLATSKTHNIGFLLNEQYTSRAEPFYTKIFLGAGFEASNFDYYVLLTSVNENYNPKQQLPRFILERNVDGVLVVGRMPHPLILKIYEMKIPLVLVDYFIEERKINAVLIDNIEGAFEVVEHLLKLGHRKISFIAGSKKHPSIKERFIGYKKAIARFEEREKVQIADESLVIMEEEECSAELGFDTASKLLSGKNRPTAIFGANDAIAIGTIKAIKKFGLKIPEDIAVVGFDDIEWGLHAEPPLTTVRVFKEEMGAAAVKKIMSLIDKPTPVAEKLIIRTELVVRDSCGGRRNG